MVLHFFTHTKCKLTFAILFGCITPHINIYTLGTILPCCFWMCKKYMVDESIESYWFVATLMIQLAICIWKMVYTWSIGTPRVTFWPNRKLQGWRRWNVVSKITRTSYNTFIWIFYRKKLSNAVLLNFVFTILLVLMNTKLHDLMILLCANMCPKSSILNIYIIDVVFCCVCFLYILLRAFIVFAAWFLFSFFFFFL